MENKEKVEELARLMCHYNAEHFESCDECKKGLLQCGMLENAERIVNSESIIMLTKSEKEALLNINGRSFDELTAFVKKLKEKLYIIPQHCFCLQEVEFWINKIAKEFGVEVEDA